MNKWIHFSIFVLYVCLGFYTAWKIDINGVAKGGMLCFMCGMFGTDQFEYFRKKQAIDREAKREKNNE